MYSPRKCGVKFDPPTLVLFYVDKSTDKLHRRSVPVRKFDEESSITHTAKDLKSSLHHGKYFESIPQKQIEKLLKIIQDKMKGLHPKPIPTQSQPTSGAKIDPDKNLNALPDQELDKVKAAMDVDFEKNRVRPGDEEFEYDKEVDFNEGKMESGWDEEEDYSDPEF